VMTTKKRVGVFPHAFIRVLALAGYGKRKLPRIFRWELVPMPIVIIQTARFIMAFGRFLPNSIHARITRLHYYVNHFVAINDDCHPPVSRDTSRATAPTLAAIATRKPSSARIGYRSFVPGSRVALISLGMCRNISFGSGASSVA